MRRPLAGNPPITNTHGNPGWGHFKKHLGYDYGVQTGTSVLAPETMRVTALPSGGSGGNMVVATANGREHRFLHLSSRSVSVGQTVQEGAVFAKSGATGDVTGPHLHHDVRIAGTAWNASFDNYFDWEQMIRQLAMPAIGSKIQLISTDTRNTFRAGTATVAGTIKVTDNSFIYTVRGYDSRYPNRVIINSKSAGGDGVALALYYTSGAIIPGWKKV